MIPTARGRKGLNRPLTGTTTLYCGFYNQLIVIKMIDAPPLSDRGQGH